MLCPPSRSLSVGYKNAYSLYALNSVDQQLEEIYSSYGDDICLVERLFSSSLLAIVSLNYPRKLKVVNNDFIKLHFTLKLFKLFIEGLPF